MRCSSSGPAPVPRSLCGPLRLPRGCGRIMDMTGTGMVMGLVSEWPRGCSQLLCAGVVRPLVPECLSGRSKHTTHAGGCGFTCEPIFNLNLNLIPNLKPNPKPNPKYNPNPKPNADAKSNHNPQTLTLLLAPSP